MSDSKNTKFNKPYVPHILASCRERLISATCVASDTSCESEKFIFHSSHAMRIPLSRNLRFISGLIALACMMIFICCIFPLNTQAASDNDLLVDEVGLLTEEESESLLTELERVSNELDTDVCVIIVESLNGQSADRYSWDYAAYYGYGRGDTMSVAMLLQCPEYRDYSMTVSGYAEDVLTDSRLSLVEDRVLDYLSDDRYYEAYMAFADGVEEYMNVYTSPYPVRFFNNLIGNPSLLVMSLVASLIISLIVAFVIKRGMNEIRFERAAGVYMAGEPNLTIMHDRFINRRVTKTRIQRQSSGGSRSSRGSSGGRSFSSRSGKY